jgi:xanthine dehydrogenase molybdopterin-binding subunit B
MSLFKVAGVSTLQGKTKVRFANDLTRVKMLTKHGHTNIELLDLPKAMTKPEVVAYLKTTDLYGKFTDAINAADEKYNGSVTVKVSMDSLKARAEAVKAEPEVA